MKFIVWILVFLAVFINHTFLKDQTFRQNIPFLDNIRYSDFLVQKWFLVIVALLIFAGWILKNKKAVLRFVQENIVYILIIVLVTLGVHWASFDRWFDFDDYRLIGHHRAVTDTPQYNSMGAVNNPYYGYAAAYLVVRWFDATFELYNGLGLFILFLIGVTIFAIARKLQSNTTVAFLIALLFTTSSTYFRQILQMHEFLGDGLPLLLFSIAIYFSVKRFYPGGIIFAAAAMEFGLSREHFIGVPLFLLIMFFAPPVKLSIGKKIAIALIFPLITFAYLPVFLNFQPQIINRSDWFSNWPQAVRLLDVIFGATSPHLMSYAVFNLFQFVYPNFSFLSPILGLMFLLTILTLIILNRKNYLGAKLLLVGLSIIVGSLIFQTLSGIRLEHNLSALHRQYLDFLPSAPTSYGLPAALGISILFLGLSQIMKTKVFYVFAIFIIIVNSLSILIGDKEWIKQFSRPQRLMNTQLEKIIPYDGKVKVIYTPHPSEILSRYVSYFYQLYRIKDQIYWTNDPNEFVRLLVRYKPSKENVYVLTYNQKIYEVHNHSELVSVYYPDRLTLPYLDSLPQIIKERDAGRD